MTKQPTTKRVPVTLPQNENATRNWLRSIRLSGFTIMTLGLVVLTVIVLAPSLRILVRQQQDIAALQAQVAQQQQTVSNLKDQRARWSDPRYIEAQARSRLYYVKPGEYSYLVINDGKTPASKNGAPISSTIQTTQVDWVRALFSSVFAAGLTTATPGQLVAPPAKGAR